MMNAMLRFTSIGLMIVALSGCVKPAASSYFSEKAQSEALITGQKEASFDAPMPDLEIKPSFKTYAGVVKAYSDRYHMDWSLVLAVMKQESRFDHEAVSYRGAYGLMQIMPVTQSELMDKLGVPDASSPRNNIKAGIYHLRSLYRVFSKANSEDRVKLSLAAYNAGLKRVIAARDIARYLGEDPNNWNAIKNTLPLLTHRYYSLHRDVWHSDKPPCGYFGGWKQTITYVDNIMQYYDEYSLALK
jgi:membrane-bound lytic murein transglycosylase MltF